MLFNSLPYALFLPCVFAIYWLLHRQLKAQNLFLLLASYFFYACLGLAFFVPAYVLYGTRLFYRMENVQLRECLKQKTFLVLAEHKCQPQFFRDFQIL